LQVHHGALHAQVGDVRERGGLERHQIGLGQREISAQLRHIDRIHFERAPQAGIDGEASSKSERRRLGQACLRQIMQQAGVVLVNSRERVLDVRERGVEDEPHNAPLLVGEERGDRVVGVAVEAVERANHLREVGALHLAGCIGGKGFESRSIGSAVALYRRGDVLVAEVEHRK